LTLTEELASGEAYENRFWEQRKLNQRADMDDVRGITRRVNGGLNGFEDRKLYLQRAKFFLLPIEEKV